MRALALLMVTCLFSPAVEAHPSHVTLMQVEVDSGRLEVAVQIHRRDLDRALAPGVSSDQLDASVQALIKGDILLKDKTGRVIPLEWVGAEAQSFSVWAYFQWTLNGTIEEHTLLHQLLLGVEPKLIHTVNFKKGAARSSLTFRRGQTTQSLPKIGP